jgi:hypothetical protein
MKGWQFVITAALVGAPCVTASAQSSTPNPQGAILRRAANPLVRLHRAHPGRPHREAHARIGQAAPDGADRPNL